MATYESLSQADKDSLQEFLNDLRTEIVYVYKCTVNAGITLSVWSSTISDIVDQLDAGEVIPNTSGRADAQAVHKANLVENLMPYVTTLASLSTSDHRDHMVPVAGARNLKV